MSTTTYSARRAALVAERSTVVTDARALAQSAKGRAFNDTEVGNALSLKSRADDIDRELAEIDAGELRRRDAGQKAQQDRAANDAAMRAQIKALGEGLGLTEEPSDPATGRRVTGMKAGEPWAKIVADRMADTARLTGVKALTTGGIDVPVPVVPEVVAWPQQPRRIIELLIDRVALPARTYTYLRQTVRENNAGPVADGAPKPVSRFTTTEIEDRARVFATLTEPFPERYIADHPALMRWLEEEVQESVMAAVERQAITGDGQDENVTGILETSGTVAVPFAVNELVTLRKARTALEMISETPNAWVFNPADLETIDLMRADGATGAFLVGGSSPAGDNVFGGLPRVASPIVPAGTAILGDWRQARLYIREELRLDADRSGPDLFRKNLVELRAEGQFGFGVLRPQAFAQVDLTA